MYNLFCTNWLDGIQRVVILETVVAYWDTQNLGSYKKHLCLSYDDKVKMYAAIEPRCMSPLKYQNRGGVEAESNV